MKLLVKMKKVSFIFTLNLNEHFGQPNIYCLTSTSAFGQEPSIIMHLCSPVSSTFFIELSKLPRGVGGGEVAMLCVP